MIRLMTLNLSPYTDLNFGGQMFSSAQDWVDEIGACLGYPLKAKPIPELLIKIGGLFNSTTREFWEMRYLFNSTIELNDSKFYELCPKHNNTPLSKAISETLEWFNTYDNTKIR